MGKIIIMTNKLLGVIIILLVGSIIYYFVHEGIEKRKKQDAYVAKIQYDLTMKIADVEKDLYGHVLDSTQNELDSLGGVWMSYEMTH